MRFFEAFKVLKSRNVSEVLDLGCGEGQLLEILAEDKSFTRLIGVDIDKAALDVATEEVGRAELINKSILDIGDEYAGIDAVTLVEVIEHFKVEDLDKLEDIIFRKLRPKVVVLTTPDLGSDKHAAPGHYSHPEHEFEWDAEQAKDWARKIENQYGYKAEHTLVNTFPLRGKNIQLIAFSLVA